MLATPVKALKLLNYYKAEGEFYAEISLTEDAGSDYLAYKGLPDVITVENNTLTKTGFNSDSHKAYYRTGVPYAKY